MYYSYFMPSDLWIAYQEFVKRSRALFPKQILLACPSTHTPPSPLFSLIHDLLQSLRLEVCVGRVRGDNTYIHRYIHMYNCTFVPLRKEKYTIMSSPVFALSRLSILIIYPSYTPSPFF